MIVPSDVSKLTISDYKLHTNKKLIYCWLILFCCFLFLCFHRSFMSCMILLSMRMSYLASYNLITDCLPKTWVTRARRTWMSESMSAGACGPSGTHCLMWSIPVIFTISFNMPPFHFCSCFLRCSIVCSNMCWWRWFNIGFDSLYVTSWVAIELLIVILEKTI